MLSTVTSTCAAFNKVDRENLEYSNNTVELKLLLYEFYDNSP